MTRRTRGVSMPFGVAFGHRALQGTMRRRKRMMQRLRKIPKAQRKIRTAVAMDTKLYILSFTRGTKRSLYMS
jgi:hypothetical protein